MAKVKAKELKFIDILEDYNIEEKELENIFHNFGITTEDKSKAKIKELLFNKLVKIIVTIRFSESIVNQDLYTWYGDGMLPCSLRYGEETWVKEDIADMIQKQSVFVSVDSIKSSRGKTNYDRTDRQQPAYIVSRILDMHKLKIPK